MFIFVQTTDGKAPVLRVCTVCCASVGVSTESISLQGDCQRVLSGRFMALWLLGLGAQPRKDGSPSKGKWATAGPTADSSPICNFLCFIYLLRNDPASKPRRLVFPSIVWKGKKKTTDKAVIFPADHLSKSRSAVTLDAKFLLYAWAECLWTPHPLIPISACVIPAPSWHTHRHIFHLPAQLLAPHRHHHHHHPLALIRVMPTPANPLPPQQTLYGPGQDNKTKWDYTQTYSGTRG